MSLGVYTGAETNPNTKKHMTTYQLVLAIALVLTTFALGRISTRL